MPGGVHSSVLAVLIWGLEACYKVRIKKKNHTDHSCSLWACGICALGSALASHLLGDTIQGVKVKVGIHDLLVVGSSLLNCVSFFAGASDSWSAQVLLGKVLYQDCSGREVPEEDHQRWNRCPVILRQPKSVDFCWLLADLLDTNSWLNLVTWLLGEERKVKARLTGGWA